MSPKVFLIAKFEVVKSLKSLSFWLLPIGFAVTMLVSFCVPLFMENFLPDKTVTDTSQILVIDQQNFLDLKNNSESNPLIKYKLSDKSLAETQKMLQDEEFASLINIVSLEQIELYTTTSNAIDKNKLLLDLQERLLVYKLDKGVITGTNKENLKKPELNQKFVTTATDSEFVYTTISYLVGSFLFFIIIVYGSLFMNQIIVEKNSKVYEVILTSIGTEELFIGKYLGFFGKTLIQIVTFLVSLIFPGILIGLVFGSNLNSSNLSQNQLPEISTEEISSQTEFISQTLAAFNPVNILVIIIFSILGVVFYSVLLSLIGACFNNYMEASNSSLSWILTLPVSLALLFNGYFIQNTNSPLAVIFQVFPLTSPISVTSFIFNDFSWVKVIIAAFVLILAIILSFKIATKVYLEGVLSNEAISLKKLWKIIRN